VDPTLLLQDEPTSRLNSTTAARIVGMLCRMATGGGGTVVVTMHQDVEELGIEELG
jgi:ABC-type phosphate/phosphonate transport system ATPase subunit